MHENKSFETKKIKKLEKETEELEKELSLAKKEENIIQTYQMK